MQKIIPDDEIKFAMPCSIDAEIDEKQGATRRYVDARVIARHYSITTRYVLQLAAENRIPHIRLGRKCVRFIEDDVARALEGGDGQ